MTRTILEQREELVAERLGALLLLTCLNFDLGEEKNR